MRCLLGTFQMQRYTFSPILTRDGWSVVQAVFMLTPIKIPYSAYIAILKYYKKNTVFLHIWNICYIFAIAKR